MHIKTKSKALALVLSTVLLLSAAVVAGCGDDEAGIPSLRALETSKVEVPEGTKWPVVLELTGIPGTDLFIDIENNYTQYVEFQDGNSVRFQPKDDPPRKTIEVTAVAETPNGHVPIKFTVRGTASTRTLQIAVVKP